jgi:tryptophan halogenase
MGCGYLFDSNYISYEDAKKEVEEYLGHSIEVKKRLSFKSGYFKDVWKGNCISIGLSGGFFEPIEATSIMTIIIQLLKLKSNSFDYTKRNFYNLCIRNVNEQILNFIRYHYVCDRDDSKFWQDYKKREMPDKLKSLLNDKNKLKVLTTKELNKILKNPVVSTVFDIPSYLIQSSGNFKKENPII